MTETVFLVHHDRPDQLDGIRLAVASIRRHCSTCRILVSAPAADRESRQWWIDRGCEELRVQADVSGWDAKPTLILHALAQGHESVLWVDSDVILTADPRAALPSAPDALVVTEEPARYPYQGSRMRTVAWGLDPGRDFPITLNTSVIRATPAHVGLLEDWQALLARADYAEAQRGSWESRPIHFRGDQDALTALLGSAAQSHTRVEPLSRGVGIAHCAGPAGFAVRDRVHSLRSGIPPFVHSMTVKPWQHRALWRYQGSRKERLLAAYEDMHLRLSPYSILARQLADEAGISCVAFDATSWWERQLLRLGHRWPQLPELPLAVAETARLCCSRKYHRMFDKRTASGRSRRWSGRPGYGLAMPSVMNSLRRTRQ